MNLEREEAAYTCGGCGQVYPEARPWRIQKLQHLLLWEHVTLWVQKRRVACPTCGLKAERHPPWVAPHARVTGKLAPLVGELCRVLTNSAVAMLLWLHPGTAKALDKRAIQAAQAARPWTGSPPWASTRSPWGAGRPTGTWCMPWMAPGGLLFAG